MIEIFLQNNLRITAFKKHLSLWFVWVNLEHEFYYWCSCWLDLSEVGHWRLRNSSCHFLQTAFIVERFYSKVAFLIAETYQFYDNQRFKFTGFLKPFESCMYQFYLWGMGGGIISKTMHFWKLTVFWPKRKTLLLSPHWKQKYL